MAVQSGRVLVRARLIAGWTCVVVASVVGGLVVSASEARAAAAVEDVPQSPGTVLKTCGQQWADYWDCISDVGPDTGRCIMPSCDPGIAPVVQ